MFLSLLSLHFLGAFLTVGSLFLGIAVSREAGSASAENSFGKKIAMLHGIGLSLLLLSGLGLIFLVYQGEGLASLWFWAKVTIWIALGGAVALVKRKPQHWVWWMVAILLLATVAGVLGQYKPCCL
jgi:uncharacterized membrane protein SirB2